MPDETKHFFKNRAMSHNHPQGTTFSPNDISALTDLEAEESRIVCIGKRGKSKGKKVNYILKRASSNNSKRFRDDYENAIMDYMKKLASVTTLTIDEKVIATNNYKSEWLSNNSAKYGYNYIEEVN